MHLQSKFPFNKDFFQLYSHPDCLLHEVGDDHPETAARLRHVLNGCAALPDRLPISFQVPPPAKVSQLERVHEKDYLMRLKIACIRSEPWFMSPDNRICPNSFRAVLAAGGCALALGETLLAGGAGFALVRPPGHHAGYRTAEGFCFINHAALTIETIRLQQPNATFLVVDLDVHHGNGLDDLYVNDPRVYYYSLHGPPEHIFPNTGHRHQTGRGAGSGYTCNITLSLESSGDDWLGNFELSLRNFEKLLHPDYLLVNAGFDAHREDPFGLMNVEDRHYFRALQLLQEIANEQCTGRIGLFLEGGYSRTVLHRLVPEVIIQLALNLHQQGT